MAAEVETMFSGGNQIPWHGQGTVIEEEVVKASEAIKHAGLDWTVEIVPLFAKGVRDGETVTGYSKLDDSVQGLQRSSDGRVLGIVSSKYKPVQNHEAFSFMDDIVDSGDAKYETAGALKQGSLVWMLARIPKEIKVGGMDGEEVATYLFLTNSFDRSKPLTVGITPVRIVCKNTLQMALNGCKRSWSTRHRGDMSGKMQEARNTLEITFEYLEGFEKMANDLLSQSFTEKQFSNLVSNLVPIEKGADMESRAIKSKVKTRDSLTSLFLHAPNLQNVQLTKWAAYNAIAEYSDHGRRGNNTAIADAEENRFARVMSDLSLKDKAFTLLTK